MSNDIIKDGSQRMEKTVTKTRDDMLHIRIGKATPNLLDSIKVDYYGNMSPINQVANISTPESRLLAIQPFDKGMIGALEKAILASDLGLTPQNDGRVIRLPIPVLTSERREELVKVVRRIAEDGRIAIRSIRHDIMDQIKAAEKSSDISEDEAHRLKDEAQKKTDSHIGEIDQILKSREAEIRED